MLFEIKSRFDGAVLFKFECESLKLCVRAAIKSGADLRGAILRGADLGGTHLYGANLYGADLGGANLRGANLCGANLYGADLRGADLYGADLYGANLRVADLRGADLRGTILYGADLRGADLYGADLRVADLRGADLRGANLRGANLGGTHLYGADLGDKAGKLLDNGFFQCGPVGSRNDYLLAFHTTKGIFVRVGCFFDSLEKFRDAVEKKTEGDKWINGYLGLANWIEWHFNGDHDAYSVRSFPQQTHELGL